ncbi:MAG: tetratricopeptide repeat protein [Phycisphaerales bacterium]|nr:tetratricopeptide repeat protein [Phycisphaerales bacterium]MCB9836364.1 tetratricopeptide repeat protein [Phycisphaera sp.]
MAFFGKNNSGGAVAGGGDDDGDSPERQPAKAKAWFSQAKTVQETGSYDYAMTCWLSGLAFDPTDMDALEGFMAAAVSLAGESKKGPSKETQKAAIGKGGAFKYTSALLAWGSKPKDAGAAVRAAIAAAGQDLAEPAYWIGERALQLTLADPKVKKDSLLRLMKAMEEIEAYDLAVKAGEAAVRLDPSDNALESRVRNMAAQATIGRGGFDNAGQQGGFRDNIRDSEKQKLLDAADRITKTDDVKDQLVEAAKADYDSRPEDVPANKTYIKRLLERGKGDDEKIAYNVALKAHEATGQTSFKQQAMEIELRVMKRQIASARAKADAGDEGIAAKLPGYEKQFLAKQVDFQLWRVNAFPTDNAPRFELGRLYFSAGMYKEAIPHFQKSQQEIKYRAMSLAMLGEAFGKIGLTDPAIDTLKQALANHSDPSDDLGFQLRYALMMTLSEKARNDRSLEAAQEAEKLASGIAVSRFDYRDIQDKYDEAKKLVAELRAG